MYFNKYNLFLYKPFNVNGNKPQKTKYEKEKIES